MSLPLRITFVRHGQSEANIIQKAQDRGEKFHLEDEINSRVDWKQRLSDKGRAEASAARTVFSKLYGGLDYFDGFYSSPFIRTRETALVLSRDNPNIQWKIDDQLSERIWGIYGVVSRQEQRSHFPLTSKLANDSPWYIRYDGGESLFDVYNRFKEFKSKLWRNNSGENVLIVAHQQLIQVACYDIEKLLPEDWDKIDKNSFYRIPNAGIVEYTRINPADARDIREGFSWRRIMWPANFGDSPFEGMWVELETQQYFSADELEGQIADYPCLINNIDE